jgi:hypothetical protein
VTGNILQRLEADSKMDFFVYILSLASKVCFKIKLRARHSGSHLQYQLMERQTLEGSIVGDQPEQRVSEILIFINKPGMVVCT